MAAAATSSSDASSSASTSIVGLGKLRKPLRYCIAVDGSELSMRTFKAAVSLRNKSDHMTVLHIADPTKTYLPFDMRASSIQEQYEVQCVGRFPKSEYSIVIRNKRLGQSTRDAVLQFVNDNECNVFCVGMIGRKGPKEDPTVLGSTADYSMRAAHCTSVVVKGRGLTFPKESLFLVACDGSKKSLFCIRQVLAMANDDDKVKVVHVVARDQGSLAPKYRAKEVRVAAEAVLAEDPRAEYVEVEEDADSAIADTIADMAIEEEATYIAMGADGVRAYAAGKSAGLGSVSDRLVKISRVSVVVTQDNDSLI